MRANNNKKVVQLLVAVCAAVMMTMMTASDAAPAAAAAAAAASAVRRTVCPFTYVVTSQWSYGFVGQVTLTDSALFLPRVTFVVVFPTSVHLYGWWNADMVEPSVPIGGQVSGTHFRFLKGDWQQGFGFSADQTSAPVTPTITIEGICDPIPTTGAATTTGAVTTTTTGAVTTTTTGAVTTTTTGAVTTSTAAVTTSTAAVTTSTAAVTTSSAATCPPPPPPAPATCPCNGLRVLKYRASIASRYAALGLHAVNLGGECIDGVYVHTDSQCIGSTPLSEIDNLAVQHWNQREVRDGVTGINLQMDNYLVLANSGGALGSADAQEPVISNVFQLGRSSSPLDSGLVCSDMFRLASIPGENTPFFTSYEETGDFSPEAQAMNDQYMAANRINVTPSQFCACIADAKVAVSEINTIKPRITDVNWNLKGTVPDLQVYFDEVAASLGVSC